MKQRKAEKIAVKACNNYKKGKHFISKIYIFILRTVFACDFAATVQLGDDIQLVHNGLGCVFHPGTKIGNRCKIYQNVTLGGNGKIENGEKINIGGPTLEDDVAVFAGACVLGPITIGHDSIIGANAVITKDVPPNSLVIGNPSIIKENKVTYNFE